MVTLASSRLQTYTEDALSFLRDIGAGLWSWQEDILREALQRRSGRFLTPLVVGSLPRGNGKSYMAACIAAWRLFCGPAGQDIISVALDQDGARVIFAFGRQLIERNPALLASARILRDEIILDTGRDAHGLPRPESRWTVEPREHTSSRGRHPTVVCYDEIGWSRDDELFSALSAAQAPVQDPLFVLVSTVGASRRGPLWQLKERADAGDPAIYYYWTDQNPSPLVTEEFLERQKRMLHPIRFIREHRNTWSEGADAFLSHALLEEAYEEGWKPQRERQDGTYYAFVDLGLIHDATVIAVAHRREDGKSVLDALRTFRGSRSQPVRVKTVVDTVARLSEAFRLELTRIESPEGGEAVVQALHEKGVRAEVLRPTVKTQQEAWGNLLSLFQNMQLVLFRHGELGRELLNLQIKNTPTGFRVFDPGGIHQDHALALAGAALLASEGGGSEFVTAGAWERCQAHVPHMGTIDDPQLVVGLDAEPLGDMVSVVACSRHWQRDRERDVVVRLTKTVPRGELVEFLVGVAGDHALVHVAFPEHAGLELLAGEIGQRIWAEPFPSSQRAAAELQLRELILGRRLLHGGDLALRSAVEAAGLEVGAGEARSPRVEACQGGDISLLRALVIASSRALYLNLAQTAAGEKLVAALSERTERRA